jgi:hypothetical protein
MADASTPTKVLKVRNLENNSEFEISSTAFVGMERDKIAGTDKPKYKVLEGVKRPQPEKKKA